MHSSRTNSTKAFTATELIVTIACLALLAIILLPAFVTPTSHAPRIKCLNNLKNIGLALRIWASDHNDHFPMQVSATNGGAMEFAGNGTVFSQFQILSNELNMPKVLHCPSDKKRTKAIDFASRLTDSNISYFLNADAADGNAASLLSGDRNLTNQALAGAHFVIITNTSPIGWNKEIHSEKGNLLFGDGHVGQFKNGSTGLAITIPNGVTNRLAVP